MKIHTTEWKAITAMAETSSKLNSLASPSLIRDHPAICGKKFIKIGKLSLM